MIFRKHTTMRGRSPLLKRLGKETAEMLVVFLVAHTVLPLAAPFVVGTQAGAASSATRTGPWYSTAPFSDPHEIGPGSAISAPLLSTIATPRNKSKLSLRNFLSYLSPSAGREDGRWKGGETNATLISNLLFRYTAPLLDLSQERRLDAQDAFYVAEQEKMDRSVTALARIYQLVNTNAQRRLEGNLLQSPKKKRVSQSVLLAKALLLHQRRNLLLTGMLRLVNTAVQAFPALLVARLLRLVEAGHEYPAGQALRAAVALVAVLTAKMITENLYFHHVVKCSTQVRGAIAGCIFDKSLRLPGGGSSVTPADSNDKQATLGVGGVLNLMQSDATLIESTALQLHTIWDGPLQIAMYTSLLFRYLGPSVLWGIAVMLLTIPVNSITLRILNRLSKFENEAKDARTKRTTESISNMKLLKLQGWEQQFANDIRSHRNDELRRHKARGVVRALNQAISNAVPALVLVATLTAYVKTKNQLKPSTIFTAISLFNQLRFPLFFYPMLIDSLANCKNALRRVSSFLSSEEISPYVETLPPINGGGSIEMKSGNFLWGSSKKGERYASVSPALYNVELKVNPGELVAVVGSVGTGKSALIKGLLGELVPVPKIILDEALPSRNKTNSALDGNSSSLLESPTVISHGQIAYCSQEAWLPKGTIREAVAFGREYDQDRYIEAIRDAGLDKDIKDGAGGPNFDASRGFLTHETDVGEGGSSLSGGQRARVALARALYGGDDTRVFLLDDCLAALDASVGATVFERLARRIRKSKAAAILVTNDPSLPRRCDRVVVMKKVSHSPTCSVIGDIGTFDELIARGHNLKSISAALPNEVEEETEELVMATADHETSEPIVVAPQIVLGGKNTIRLVGGYEYPANETARGCHADPECQVGMENCPDYIADKVVPESPDVVEEQDIPQVASAPVETKIIEVTVEAKIPTVEKPTESLQLATTLSPPVPKLTSTDDAMASGAIPLSTYVTYFKAVRSPLLVIAMLSAYLLANGAQFFQQYIVAKWTETGTSQGMAAVLGAKYLRSLVIAAGVVSVFLWLRSFLTMKVGLSASEFMHNRMLKSVFAAPMSFFDATPSGQLLSRFGKELETVDRALPDGFGSVLFCFLQIFMSCAALAGVITPAMLVPLGLVGILYGTTMAKFRPAARDMKRAESKTRSPIYTHFGEALRGTEIIRSIPGAEVNWSSRHRELNDVNLAVFYTVKALDRWLSCRLENLGNIVVFTAAVASVVLTRAGRLKAGSAGWGLTQSLAITGLMTWAVRTLTDLETQMMSVMRVKELTDLDLDQARGEFPKGEQDWSPKKSRMPRELSLPGEALKSITGTQSPINVPLAPDDDHALLDAGWPWKGDVKFNKVSMRYNPVSPLVLKEVSLHVPPGTTLGVVGRTGSGKSSLLLTLFRLVEVEIGGSIEIDGVDIRSVSLQSLRQSLAIIPQDPILFAGTIMYNLDATGKASSEDAWAALEAASPELAQQFRNSGGLDTVVNEGGKNLSLGQRQLVCLARALLRKSKILILDEATASIDSATDQLVQATIRREFVEKGVTVITVAHRLETVLGYDKIAVLGNGELLEYGTPKKLLQIPGGELRQLVQADRRRKQLGTKSKPSKLPESRDQALQNRVQVLAQ